MSDSEKSFLIQLLELIRRWKRFIIINVCVFTLTALIISLLLTKIYRAEAKIMAGKSDLSQMGLSSFAVDLPFQGLGLIPQSDETLRYLAILSSRTVMMQIAEKFNLQARYEQKNWEKTLRTLQQNVLIDVNPEETISVFVSDESPEIAAEMSNAFVHALDSMNIQLRIEKARNNRIFLESRLQECKTELTAAEENLKNFQERFGVLEVSEQAIAAIQTISKLETEVLMKETELRYKLNYLSENHIEVRRLKTNLKELNTTLRQMRYGFDTDSANGTDSFIIPSKDVPNLALQYFRF
ncbi:MAG: Wzz/FepE/Etk N-terminal domain-containing protein, partial [bacterium]